MKKIGVIILLFIIPIISYPLIATRNIIKNNHLHEIAVTVWMLTIASGSFCVFIWPFKYAKIRTNLLRTMFHKTIFSIFNLSLFPLVTLILKGRLKWFSEDSAYLLAFFGSMFELIFSSELRKIKGGKIYELYFEYFIVPLTPIFSSLLFALAYHRIISLSYELIHK